MMSGFRALGISEWICSNCSSLQITKPTDIQRSCIPRILAGEDVIGQAKTGSGKTAAFALPIIEKLSRDPFGIFALILTPSRELAYQINEQFIAFFSNSNFSITVVVGGLDMMKQAAMLRKPPNIVVSTPGRLADHLNSSPDLATCFSNLKFLVLDEADRLLEPSFTSELDRIISCLPSKDRQTLLFSATMSKSIDTLRLNSTRPTYVYETQNEYEVVDTLSQYYIFIPQNVKDCYLVYMLRQLISDPEDDEDESSTATVKAIKPSCIVFISTCRKCEIISEMLLELGIENVALHSNINQSRRLASLGKFKSGVSRILLATDVASRGLDIPSVERVINYDLPILTSSYIHRVGRTARAGRGGDAVSLITQYDLELFSEIESSCLNGKKLSELSLPETKVLEELQAIAEAKRVAKMRLERYKLKEKVNLKKTKSKILKTISESSRTISKQSKNNQE